jgi:ATP-dependent RNA helicase SUPV3L1/SUV3
VANGLDILVASDAVGMGLNLNIRRIIFSTLEKFDGIFMWALTVAEIKQIAG